MRGGIYQNSLEVILGNQAPSGAFVACPSFPPYRYAWFRDGSFCAYALDRVGCVEPAERFHRWAARTVLRHRGKIETCLEAVEAGQALAEADFFHCRFTVEGEEVDGHWGHHQLDGLGTWLWALEQHLAHSGALLADAEVQEALSLVGRYLRGLWRRPCSDCWEENETQVHTSTLAAIYAGLQALRRMRGDGEAGRAAEEIRAMLLGVMRAKGSLTKSLEGDEVDASLLGAAIPYGLVGVDEPLFAETLRRIEAELLAPDGGVHRYARDSYYGGGEWLLLSAWYAWVKLRMGDAQTAGRILAWIEAQAGPGGDLPEQVYHYMKHPGGYAQWVKQWGESASPLVWSHAMYVVVKREAEGGVGLTEA